MIDGAIVVVGRRSPIARLDGDLAGVDAQALGAIVVRALLDTLGETRGVVDDVIVASAAGAGGNLARRIAVLQA